MKITWVPSKRAIEAGNVPANWQGLYDIDTDESPIPEASLGIMVTRAFRHMYNNEAASAYLAETKKGEKATPPTVPDKAEFLNKWRTEQRTKILEGKLGLRDVVPGKTYTEVETEARFLAFARVKAHIIKQGGTFDFKELNTRSLAKEYEGKSVETWMDELLNRETSKRAARIWALAEENVAKRHADAAEDDEDDDFFAASETETPADADAEKEDEPAAAE